MPVSMWAELPLFVSETTLDTFLEDLKGRLQDDRSGFVAHSLGWIDYLTQRVGKDRIASGGYLYCSNRFGGIQFSIFGIIEQCSMLSDFKRSKNYRERG